MLVIAPNARILQVATIEYNMLATQRGVVV